LEKLLRQKESRPLRNSSKDSLAAFSTTELRVCHPNWELNVALFFPGVHSKTEESIQTLDIRRFL